MIDFIVAPRNIEATKGEDTVAYLYQNFGVWQYTEIADDLESGELRQIADKLDELNENTN